jgi:hypothetical protein
MDRGPIKRPGNLSRVLRCYRQYLTPHLGGLFHCAMRRKIESMKTKRNTFSRFNQPVPCRMCGKSTTWSEANGNHGLDLCGPCFERAGLENDHLDNGHGSAVAGCPVCEKTAAAAKVEGGRA